MDLMVSNVWKRLDRVERQDNNNDGWRNGADRIGNYDRRPEQHVIHNFDDFEDVNDVVGDDDFKHETIGHGDGFRQSRGWRDDEFWYRIQFDH